ncbi:pentatricopeptide repeat-containing protein [Dorcoceras hygrometricum]|uniref:Pentatricopeptide repeat-containing protein n=1 Tax=Dorcoceras hygrometricum TaxID=472368 RepID=A0A2Z7AB85_9LAMI|nr:pentatricopeptide repeat-containing protein [Dorcoceras hygrometricum]
MCNLLGILNLLNQCSDVRTLVIVHAKIVANGMFAIPSISCGLLSSYAVCTSSLLLCRTLFHQIKNPHIQHWNTIIKIFSQSRNALQAIRYYNHMLSCSSSQPAGVTFSLLLKACENSKAGSKCKEIHGSILRLGFGLDVVICTNLIRAYAVIGEVGDMRRVFDEMCKKNLVTWNSVISSYSQMGFHDEALKLFEEMKFVGVGFDGFSLVSLLSACAHAGKLSVGLKLHELGREKGLLENVFVGNALIEMYAKCGCLADAVCVFNSMKKRDVYSWNSIIVGHGVHGFGDKAISFFKKMLRDGMKPDSITFLGLLCGCSHQGLVDDGVRVFYLMSSKFGLKPDIKHYGCMVDLFGRSGKLEKALNIIENSQFPNNAILWRTFLSSCKVHKDVNNGERAVQKLSELGVLNGGDGALLAGIYAEAKDLEGFSRIRKLIKYSDIKTTPSWSWIEINGRIHRFLVNDRSKIDSDEIYGKLEEITHDAILVGYIRDSSASVCDPDIDQSGKRFASCHSEKLAIAFGIARTGEGTCLRIVKNLRVCKDCHSFTKFVAKAYNREIIVRDRVRFHHFRNGLCSCKDYW